MPPASKRQLIAEVGVELVTQTEGGDSPAEGEIVNIEKGLGLILAGVGRAARIVIERLGKSVIHLEGQAARGAFDERGLQGVVATGALEQLLAQLVHKGIGVAGNGLPQR